MSDVQTRTVARDEAGMRLDRWFKAHYPGLGFGHLQKLLRTGQVRVDGARVKTATRLAAGQVVRVPPIEDDDVRAPRPRPAAGTDADYLRGLLLYEDDDVFVFNKPPGLAVQGGSGLTRHLDGMLAALAKRSGNQPRLVHRLDRDTSGVLVVARTRPAAAALAGTFRGRDAHKVYWAIVKGVPSDPEGRISTFLAKTEGPQGDRMKVARHGDERADHAVTLFRVIDQAGNRLSWLAFEPVTGRTHQIRAHAAHIGHPIIGDPKYFNVENWELPGGIQKRLHLHARRIVVPHPRAGTVDVVAPLPDHMRQTWNLLGFDEARSDATDFTV